MSHTRVSVVRRERAARGIGLATTDLFLAEGRRVAMVDRDSDILAEEAGKRDGVVALHCDVSDPDDVAKMAEDAVAKLGRVDALVLALLVIGQMQPDLDQNDAFVVEQALQVVFRKVFHSFKGGKEEREQAAVIPTRNCFWRWRRAL